MINIYCILLSVKSKYQVQALLGTKRYCANYLLMNELHEQLENWAEIWRSLVTWLSTRDCENKKMGQVCIYSISTRRIPLYFAHWLVKASHHKWSQTLDIHPYMLSRWRHSFKVKVHHAFLYGLLMVYWILNISSAGCWVLFLFL